MSDNIMEIKDSNELYLKIVNLITLRKTAASQAMNAAMVFPSISQNQLRKSYALIASIWTLV